MSRERVGSAEHSHLPGSPQTPNSALLIGGDPSAWFICFKIEEGPVTFGPFSGRVHSMRD